MFQYCISMTMFREHEWLERDYAIDNKMDAVRQPAVGVICVFYCHPGPQRSPRQPLRMENTSSNEYCRFCTLMNTDNLNFVDLAACVVIVPGKLFKALKYSENVFSIVADDRKVRTFRTHFATQHGELVWT